MKQCEPIGKVIFSNWVVCGCVTRPVLISWLKEKQQILCQSSEKLGKFFLSHETCGDEN